MPVSPTYPGVYIEEIQSSSHTITAAPTNIAVFVGYSHPFLTVQPGTTITQFDQAILLQSFTDYESNFGGFFGGKPFSPDDGDPNNFFGSLPMAVYQFFLNGGTECYVVGLQAQGSAGGLTAGTATTVDGITFTSLQPTDASLAMSITITPKPTTPTPLTSPPTAVTAAQADIAITYGTFDTATQTWGAGSAVEVFRKVKFQDIASTINNVSKLVTVAQPPTSPPGPFQVTTQLQFSQMSPLTALSITQDFFPVFQQDTSLDKVPVFNMMVLPGVLSNTILSEALSFCELKRAFLIMDPPQNSGIIDNGSTTPPTQAIDKYLAGGSVPLEPSAALYFPYLKSNDPQSGDPIEIPPAATVCGIYAQTDLARGVWKAPAGLETVILGSTGPVARGMMTDARQGVLNPLGINCLRFFPNVGTVVFGARTSGSANTALQQWKYVPVRRMALFLEQTLYANLGWVVFEPNDTPLWNAIVASIEAFMLGLFRQGAFQGDTPSKAFSVQCDSTTTSQADIDNGIVNILVAFAPLKPAEFVVVQIAQLAGQTQTS